MAEGGEDSEDKDAKTEEPSQKKLEDALQKGQVMQSKEVTSFFALLFLTLIVIWLIPDILANTAKSLRFLVENAYHISADRGGIGSILYTFMYKIFLYLSPIFVMVIVAPIISSYIQHGEFIFTGEQMMPKLSKISLIKGFSRLFSIKNLVEFIKNIFKILLVGMFVYLIILSDIKQLHQYQNLSIGAILELMRVITNHLLICVCIIVCVIAALDFAYQKYEHYTSLKMTKHEQKEEYKQTEGSIEIKRKIKQLRREQAQKKNIKKSMSNATVVVTNPEHYAIALQYEVASMKAPIVVAKGLDFMAQKIRELAVDSMIPIVENPPLARALYKDVKINEEIPIEHYEAVAKIISYVMTLNENKKNKK